MIYWGVYHILEFVNYYLVYRTVFAAQFRKGYLHFCRVLFATCLCTEALIWLGMVIYGEVIIILSAFLGMLMLSEKEQKQVFLLFPMVYSISGYLNILGSYLFSAILSISYSEFLLSPIGALLSECTGIVFFAVVSLWKRKERNSILKFSLSQYVLMLLGVVSLFFLVAFSQGILLGRLDEMIGFRKEMAIGCILLGILFVTLIMWQYLIQSRAHEYQLQNERYKRFLEQQEEHIRNIVEADEKIRRFRHDIHAHIIALEAGIASGDWLVLQQYVNRMKQGEEAYQVHRFTDVATVDAVISEWYQRAVDKQVVWNWSGKLALEEKVDIYDLCVLFSNLLSNAVEAVERMEGGESRKIEVLLNHVPGCICIKMCNSCDNEVGTVQKLTTSKTDTKNHGFGMKNIQGIVEKYQGSMQYEWKNRMFCIEIIL